MSDLHPEQAYRRLENQRLADAARSQYRKELAAVLARIRTEWETPEQAEHLPDGCYDARDWSDKERDIAVATAVHGVLDEIEAALGGQPSDTPSGTHTPFTDDGVTYCGWDGKDGCGEVWPCSTVRRQSAAAPSPG